LFEVEDNETVTILAIRPQREDDDYWSSVWNRAQGARRRGNLQAFDFPKACRTWRIEIASLTTTLRSWLRLAMTGPQNKSAFP